MTENAHDTRQQVNTKHVRHCEDKSDAGTQGSGTTAKGRERAWVIMKRFLKIGKKNLQR